MMRKCFFTVMALLVCGLTQAQIEVLTEAQVTAAGGDHNPLWLNANKYGLSSLDKTNGYVRAGAFRSIDNDSSRRWAWGAGLDLAVAGGFTSTFVVHQAYGELRWLKGLLTVGSKEQPMELKNQELSSGSQTFGINARPVPTVRLSLPDYWVVPYTRQWLAVKGHVAYGMTTDDGWQKDFTHQQSRYTEHALYHSKAGYLRIGPKNITVEFGLEMACQFGGTLHVFDGPQETVINADKGLGAFFHALVPGGNDATDGDWHNAEGNHLGSWVARVNFDYPKWNLGVYADHFFEDNSSMLHVSYAGWGKGDEAWVRKDNRYFLHDFKDWMLGAELKLKENPWLNDIVVEYLYKSWAVHRMAALGHGHGQPVVSVASVQRGSYHLCAQQPFRGLAFRILRRPSCPFALPSAGYLAAWLWHL